MVCRKLGQIATARADQGAPFSEQKVETSLENPGEGQSFSSKTMLANSLQN
jgi:hypothetical protein